MSDSICLAPNVLSASGIVGSRRVMTFQRSLHPHLQQRQPCWCTGGVLQDDPIAKLTPTSVRAVFAPKVDAASNLQHSSWAAPLTALNAFSSVASFIGSAGQGNYAAANSVLDAWAGSLQASGISGTSPNLFETISRPTLGNTLPTTLRTNPFAVLPLLLQGLQSCCLSDRGTFHRDS